MSYIIIRGEISIIHSNTALALRIYINKCGEINIIVTKNISYGIFRLKKIYK
jgi:hypothetical protein